MNDLPDEIINKIVMSSIPAYPYLEEIKKEALLRERIREMKIKFKSCMHSVLIPFDSNEDLPDEMIW